VEITLNIRALKDTGAAVQPCRHAGLKEQLALGLIQLGSQSSMRSVFKAVETQVAREQFQLNLRDQRSSE